ncbi:hypothetical protein DM01DRAFT_1385638 [Hesseltinella vesiculosa]|uniref:Uncharacterized protein n=1 Tax=Hesseltinella vesiculosa TaxID=101127 RepID=A0A1X2G8N4_9FUNG|nr:hypothetical protein DM01DRAFT_1385638 [Hesseltinella vesiculosa]
MKKLLTFTCVLSVYLATVMGAPTEEASTAANTNKVVEAVSTTSYCPQLISSTQDLFVLLSNPLLNGIHCSEEQQRLMEQNLVCGSADDASVVAALNAQTKCLRDFIERRQRLSPGAQVPYPTV